MLSAVRRSFCLSFLVLITQFLLNSALQAQSEQAAKGVAWLSSKQNSDGSWSQDKKQLIDSVEAFKGIYKFDSSAAEKSLSFFNSLTEDDNAKLALKALILSYSSADTSNIISTLISNARDDGGWGLTGKKQSNIANTSIVINALLKATSPNSSVIAKARDYLTGKQQTNGSYIYSDETSPSDLVRTARILITLKGIQNAGISSSDLDSAINKCVTYIEANLVTATPLVTKAWCYLALIKVKQPSEVQDLLSELLDAQQSNGSWNESVYTTGVVLQAIAAVATPEQGDLPDLKIESSNIIISPVTPVTGQSATLQATIFNSGKEKADNVKVEFFNGDPRVSGSAIGTAQVVSSIPSDGSAQVSVPFATTSLVGSQQVYVFVDYDNTIEEESEINNTASKTINIAGIPELEITADNIVLSNSSPTAFQSITVTATVNNTGTGDASNIPVQIIDNGNIIANVTLSGVNADDSNNVVLTASFAAGTHNLAIKLSAVPNEQNTTNNEAVKVFSVAAPASSPADLQVSALSTSPSVPTAGETVEIKATVINAGGTASGSFDVVLKSGGTAIHTFSGIDLGPGCQAILTYSTTLAAGTYSLEAVADSKSTVAESDETNNTRSQSITVAESNAPVDIEVVSVSVPTGLSTGQAAQILMIVRNNSTQSAENVILKIYDNDVQIGEDITISELAGGATHNIQYNYIFMSGGTHVIKCVADPGNLIAEGNENNNENQTTANIAVSPLPDLIISPEDVSFSDTYPNSGETVTISAVVKNTGTNASGNFKVLITSGNPLQTGAVLIDEQEVSGLAAGGQLVVSADYIASGGTEKIYIYVDSVDAVSEISENNNLVVSTLNPADGPDLTVDANYITFTHTDLDTNSMVGIKAKIDNIGNQAAENIKVIIAENSSGTLNVISTQTLSSLSAGTSEEIEAVWQASPGAKTIVVLIDQENNIAEANEYNNSAEKNVFFSSSQVALKIYKSVDGNDLTVDSFNPYDVVKIVPEVFSENVRKSVRIKAPDGSYLVVNEYDGNYYFSILASAPGVYTAELLIYSEGDTLLQTVTEDFTVNSLFKVGGVVITTNPKYIYFDNTQPVTISVYVQNLSNIDGAATGKVKIIKPDGTEATSMDIPVSLVKGEIYKYDIDPLYDVFIETGEYKIQAEITPANTQGVIKSELAFQVIDEGCISMSRNVSPAMLEPVSNSTVQLKTNLISKAPASDEVVEVSGTFTVPPEQSGFVVTCHGGEAGYSHRLGWEINGVISQEGIEEPKNRADEVFTIPAEPGDKIRFFLYVYNTGATYFTDNPIQCRVTETSDRKYLVGFEDMGGGGDGDYNDVTFSFDFGSATTTRKFTNVVLTETLPLENLIIDQTSFSLQPTSITENQEAGTVELKFDLGEFFSIDQYSVSYKINLSNLVPGEEREVKKSSTLTYTDYNGNNIEVSLGSETVQVQQAAELTLSVDKDQYVNNENVNISLDMVLNGTAMQKLSTDEDWTSGTLSNINNTIFPGSLCLDRVPESEPENLIVNGDFENGDGWDLTPWMTQGWDIWPEWTDEWYDNPNVISGITSMGIWSYESPVLYQDVTIPADAISAKLYADIKIPSTYSNKYLIQVRNTSNQVLATLLEADVTQADTVTKVLDVSEFKGQTVRISFSYKTSDYSSWIIVDNVKLEVVRAAYNPSGTARYIIDAGKMAAWDKLIYNAQVPAGTSLQFRTRSSDSIAGLENEKFSNPFTGDRSTVPSSSGRFLEIEVAMSTTNVGQSPVLDDLKVTYVDYDANDKLSLVVSVFNASGQKVRDVDTVVPALELGREQNFKFVFNTENNTPGNYYAKGELYIRGAVAATASDNFEITAEDAVQSVTGSISTDKIQYAANEQVGITSKVMNNSPSLNLNGISVNVKVQDSSNNILQTNDYSIASLIQKSTDNKQLTFATASNPIGAYTVIQTASMNGEVLFTNSAQFEIVADVQQGKGLIGDIKAEPMTVKRKSGSADLNISATNTGNVDLSNVELKVCVYDPSSYQIIKSFASTANLVKAAAYSNTFNYPAIELLPGSYPITLTANFIYEGESISIPLDVNGMTVTNDAPVANAGVDQSIEGTSGSGMTFTLSGSGSTDANSTNPPAMNNDITSYQWKEGDTVLSNEMAFSKLFTWGVHNLTLTVTDSLGLTSTDSVVITVADTVAPTITNMSPANDSIDNSAFPQLSANVADACSGVNFSSAILTVDGNVLTATTNSTSGTVTASQEAALTDGWHNVVLKISDNAGNQATSGTWKIGIDTTAPAITNYSPVNDSITLDNTPVVNVKIADEFSGIKVDTISLTIDGTAVTATYDSTTGIVSYTPAAALTDGWHDLVLTVSDKAGNSSTSATWKLGIDTAGPAVTDYGPVNNTITIDSTPDISIKVADAFSGIKADTITLSIDGQTVTSAYDAATGIVTATAPTLSNNWHNLVLNVSDNAGNSSTSAAWKIGVDNLGPAITDLVPANNEILADSTPELSAKAVDAFSGVNPSTIILTVDGTAVAATYTAETGIITAPITTALADTWHNAVLKVSDNAGNQRILSDWKFGIDTTAPVISDYGPVSNTITADSTPDLSVKIADAFSGIKVDSIAMTVDGIAVSAAYDAATGIVSYTPATALTDTWHNITLNVSDIKGNAATSIEWKVGVDTTAPTTTNLVPANNAVVTDSTPAISIDVADSFSGIKADSIVLTVDSTALTASYDAATGKITATPTTALADGLHNIGLKVSDNMANETVVSNWKITVDTTAPVISDYVPANDAITGDSTPAFSVKVTDAGSGIKGDTIVLKIDDTAVTHSFDSATGIVSYTPVTALADGWHNLSLTVSDNAGNQATSSVWKVGVDTTKPTISGLTPANESMTYEKRPAISAVVADSFSGIDASTIQLKINDTVVTHTYDAATGKVTATLTEDLPGGAVTVSLSVKDRAGNENTSSAWSFTVLSYLVFHNSTSGQLDISGSNKVINGRIHSNADINIVGTNTDVMDVASAVGSIKVNGSKMDVDQQQAGAPSQTMPAYDINYYKDNADYTHDSDLTIDVGDNLASGIHYVKGNVMITKDVDLDVTIVATGSIKLVSSDIKLRTVDTKNHIVLYSATNIDLSCNNAYLKGIIYAPNGECKLASNGNTLYGALIANTIDISGSVLNISPINAEPQQ